MADGYPVAERNFRLMRRVAHVQSSLGHGGLWTDEKRGLRLRFRVGLGLSDEHLI